jgi:hypothetical protein
MWKRIHVKYPLFLSDFNELGFSRQIFENKKAQISSFIKILPVGAKLFHVDGQTDGQINMTKLIVAFRNFANAPNNETHSNNNFFLK